MNMYSLFDLRKTLLSIGKAFHKSEYDITDIHTLLSDLNQYNPSNKCMYLAIS